MRVKDARNIVELAIRKCWDGFNIETDRIDIYAWEDGSDMRRHRVVGFRVAEVSFWRDRGGGTGGGSSYMQSDAPHGLLVCAATERAVIAFVEEWPAEQQHEEIWRLALVISEDDETAKRVADEVVPEGIYVG